MTTDPNSAFPAPPENHAAPPDGVADNSQNLHSGSSRKKAKSAKPPDEPYYQAKSGAYLTGKRLESFRLFWEAYDFAKGKAEAADAWLNIPELTDSLVSRICDAARQESSRRRELEAKGQSPKWAQGWLSGRRWEDYDAAPATPVPKFVPPPRELTPEERQKALETMNRLQVERSRKRCERLGAQHGGNGLASAN